MKGKNLSNLVFETIVSSAIGLGGFVYVANAPNYAFAESLPTQSVSEYKSINDLKNVDLQTVRSSVNSQDGPKDWSKWCKGYGKCD